MSLIEQLGGYEECIRLRAIKAASSFRIRDIEFTREDLEIAMLEHRRENNIFECGDLVVRKNKKARSLIWEVVGYSNVFKDSAICDNESELLNHFSFSELRHATDEEIKAGHRL